MPEEAADPTTASITEVRVRAVVQRVREASVRVAGEEVGAICAGLLAFVGVAPGDGPAEVAWVARKLATLRVFADDAGKMNQSVVDQHQRNVAAGGVLLVSQFTLCADLDKGNRPSFGGAMEPVQAQAVFESLVVAVQALVPGRVATGQFGADMQVALINDGPATFFLDSASRRSTGNVPSGQPGSASP